jgi:hypothetical protein
MLRHQTTEILYRIKTPLLNFIRWSIQDSIGRITVLGIGILASFIIQMNNIELDYGLQTIIHLLSIGGPFLMFVLCLTSREMGITRPGSETLIFGSLIILGFGLASISVQALSIILMLPLVLIGVSSILILIIWVMLDFKNNVLTRTGYILCNTFLSSGLISFVAIAMTFGYSPATLISRTYGENQIVISVYEYEDVNIIGTADTINYPCRHRVEQRQFVPGILVKIRELNEQCSSNKENYSIEFRSKP